MDRRNILLGLVLLIAAAATQLLIWWLRPPPKPSEMVGPPRSSYTLTDFTLDALGEDGSPSFHLTSPYLARREGDDSLYVNAPKFVIVGSNGADWHGTSQYGWVSADNSLLKLIGKVDMLRPATAATKPAEVHTADATVWTQEKRMASAAPSVIQQTGSILRGVGMKADMNTHSLELLADVHATLTPQPRKH
ncbi:MAG TPA: LPS export ABC transporter periplasmic protein LptC [Rhodanobacteraceae bacterium]|nr:LPS export ABC transporter periplasmic protein LptC [Rhodanobacteraceae bacterium]